MSAPAARYRSLDFLRGLTILGMVLSAIQPHGVMPGWMYHVQNPPPTHALDMSVPGIGWVDMVFPIFIFCMGAAIPFARPSLKGIFSRFAMLWLFSYLYVFINSSCSWVTLAGFAALFPLYMVFKSPPRILVREVPVVYIRCAGLLLVLAVVAVNHFCFGEVISVQRRGIIIFLLAFLYLFGSLIWHFTSNDHVARAGVFGIVLAFTLVTQYWNWPVTTYANPDLRWWFNVEYFYFLLLLIPATYIGDLLKKRIDGGVAVPRGKSAWGMPLLALLCVALVVWMLYAFYMQLYWWNLLLSGIMLGGIYWIVRKEFPAYLPVVKLAAYLIMAGEIIEPCGGGIRKVPCTIQYCLATCGMSMLLLIVADYICSRLPGSFVVGVFEGAGKNPLMCYIAFDCLVLPLMKITGAVQLYRMAYPEGMHLVGFIRSAVVVLFTMWVVGLFTRKRIFWKA